MNDSTDMKYELRLRTAGMFSNVNEVVQYLHLAEIGKYTFHIDWRHSCYKEDKYGSNPWEYYFEQCFSFPESSSSLTLLPVGKPIACSQHNIITPRIHEGQCNPLLLPSNRQIPYRLITQYLHLKPDIKERIEHFFQQHFSTYMIGLHLRGLGRNHGGAAQMRHKGQEKLTIDYDRFFPYVDSRLIQEPDTKIFVCSDSQDVIDCVYRRYGDKVVTYDASRSAFGEMHAGHQKNEGISFSPYKLGLDVVIEAYLLSKTHYFIHGNSNVANFVLSLAPDLESNYVYQSSS